ncbi:MAG TPA: type II toxin-antitoxin system VapC family toxin [bacterium]|nr:type II toxin-antitoxin system VapC family toxin [bacterium]
MAGQVCVDASVVLMLLLPDDLTAQAESLWQFWMRDEIEPVTAPLFFAEVTSVLREHVYHGHLRTEDGDAAFLNFTALAVRSVVPDDLQPQAWRLAKKYNRPRAYDAQYLAVATRLGCDLWTADRRLVNSVNAPWVRWLGDAR